MKIKTLLVGFLASALALTSCSKEQKDPKADFKTGHPKNTEGTRTYFAENANADIGALSYTDTTYYKVARSKNGPMETVRDNYYLGEDEEGYQVYALQKFERDRRYYKTNHDMKVNRPDDKFVSTWEYTRIREDDLTAYINAVDDNQKIGAHYAALVNKGEFVDKADVHFTQNTIEVVQDIAGRQVRLEMARGTESEAFEKALKTQSIQPLKNKML